MFTRHVIRQLAAYLHGELNGAQVRRVVAHLEVCPRCRAELNALRQGEEWAAHLPLCAAPDRVWARVEAALPPSTAAIAPIRLPVGRLKSTWRLRMAASALLAGVMLIGGYLAFAPRRHPVPVQAAGPAWSVERLDGQPLVNAQRIRGHGRLGVGQWLVTDATSRAEIDVTGIGHVEVGPNSRIRLIETHASAHRMALDQGRVSAHIDAPPRLFLVDTPSAIAVDLGCSYTLQVDPAGNSLLHVLAGQVALDAAGHAETLVTAGGICATRRGLGTGTPYMQDAAPALRVALTRYDFENGGENALKAVLAHARQSDILTVWNLLLRVPPAERGRVADWLLRYFPLPQGATRQGILRLDPAMVFAWKLEIGMALTP